MTNVSGEIYFITIMMLNDIFSYHRTVFGSFMDVIYRLVVSVFKSRRPYILFFISTKEYATKGFGFLQE